MSSRKIGSFVPKKIEMEQKGREEARKELESGEKTKKKSERAQIKPPVEAREKKGKKS